VITPTQIKEWGILVTALVVDLLSMWLLRFIGFNFVGNWPVTGMVVILLIAASIATALALSLTQSRVVRGVFIIALVLLSSAVGRFEISALIGAVVLLVSILGATRVIIDETQNRITYGTRVVYRAGLKFIVIGFMAVMLSYLFPIIVNYINHNDQLVTSAQVEPFIRPVQPLVNQILPTYQPQPGIQTSLIGQDTVASLVAGILNRYVGTATHDYPLFFAALVVLILYMSIYAFIPFLVWPALAVMALLMWLLRVTGVVTTVTESIPVERLRLS